MGFKPQTLGLAKYFVPSSLNTSYPCETLCGCLKDGPQILHLPTPHPEAELNPLPLRWAELSDSRLLNIKRQN